MGAAADRCGVCDCFYDPKALEDNQASQRPAPVKKVKPLLLDLEVEFAKYAVNGKIQANGLAKLWLELATKKNGRLTNEEKALIEDSSAIFLQRADIDTSGTLDFIEFSTYMLGDAKEHEVLTKIRKELKQSGNKEDLTKLREVVAKFTECDRNGDGFIDKNEIDQFVTDLAVVSGTLSEFSSTESTPLLKQDALLKTLTDEMEKNADGRINLWDVIALALGRRKTPVELLLYDISNGVSQKFSSILLGRKFEAIYHSGVLSFGSEYWYGGDVFRTEPPNTELFGEPLKKSVTNLVSSQYTKGLQVVPLGYTLCTIDEFHTFLAQEVMPKYTRETYDVLEHNCNHCANEMVKFLTGREIPDQVRRLPELVMNTPTARLLKPFLNKWLGGFAGKGGMNQGKETFKEEGRPISMADGDAVHQMVLGGDVVEVELSGDLSPLHDRSRMNVIATVTKTDGDKLEIKYFNPESGKFSTASITRKDVIEDVNAKRCVQVSRSSRSHLGSGVLDPPFQPLRPTPFDTLGPYDTRGTAFGSGPPNGRQRPTLGTNESGMAFGAPSRTADLYEQLGMQRPPNGSSLGGTGLNATMPVGSFGTSQFGLSGPTSLTPLESPRTGGLGLDDTLPVGGSQYGRGPGLAPLPPLNTYGLGTSQNGLGSNSYVPYTPGSPALYGGRDMPTSGLGSSQFGLSGPRTSPLDTFGTSGLSQPFDAANRGPTSLSPPLDTRGIGTYGLSQPPSQDTPGFGTSGVSQPFGANPPSQYTR